MTRFHAGVATHHTARYDNRCVKVGQFVSFFYSSTDVLSNQKIQINQSIRATPGAAHDLRPLCYTCLGVWWRWRWRWGGYRRKRISGFEAVIISKCGRT